MSYASKAGRARTSARNPQAFAVCDRCGVWHNRVNLSFQFDWRGTALQNLWILVCKRCLDRPQEQLRAIQLPADPTPVWQPRVEAFSDDETDYRSTLPIPVDPIVGIPVPSKTALRVTQDCENRITQPIGCPDGLEQNAVMPYNGSIQKAFGVKLPVLSISTNGTNIVTVTCSAVHGLHPNDQVSVAGTESCCADGFYSVNVLTATAFTYATARSIAAGALLTPTTRIVTALVGIPYGSDQIPLVDCCP